LGTEQLIFDEDELEKELDELDYKPITVPIATFPDVPQPQDNVIEEKIVLLN
jgi:hypothetical protein